MHKSRLIGSLAAVALAFVGCSGSTATPTLAPTAAPTATATPVPATKLTIAYEENCQMELIAPSGQRILIDVYDPNRLTEPAKATDILLTSHGHGDHASQPFIDSFPGKMINAETKDLTVGDITIRSIAASHDETPVDMAAPSNHIFVIQFNGFKIVHDGSTGQLALTPDQLAAIGDGVDIAALDMMNVGGMDAKDDKAINVATQVSPKLLIPTHSQLAYIQAAGKIWPATFSRNKTVTVSHDQLPAKTTLLMMGLVAPSYGIILNAPESTW
jgi:L-ascorbate metabolism protein UlaG (beta-lactamase superfamily)